MALPPKYSADFCKKTAFILPLSSPPMAKCPIRKYLSGPSKFSVQPRGSVSWLLGDLRVRSGNLVGADEPFERSEDVHGWGLCSMSWEALLA